MISIMRYLDFFDIFDIFYDIDNLDILLIIFEKNDKLFIKKFYFF